MQYLIAISHFIFILLPRNCSGDVFSAIQRMEELIKTESTMIDILRDYIEKTEEKIQRLNWHLQYLNIGHKKAKSEMETYLMNPVNAYLLTKRLTSDWEKVEGIMTQDVGNETVRNITYHRENNFLIFPTEEDLNGAADAIVRLQELYNLNASSLAKGDVKGVQTGSELSSSDCFEVGRQCYKNKDYHNCIKWMKEAFHRYHGEMNKTSDEFAILDFLSYCSFMEGDIESAYHLTGKLLEIDPNVKYLRKNRIFYKNALKQQENLLERRNESDVITVMTEKEFRNIFKRKNDYERLCRNELTISEKVRAKLKCRYVDFGRPFLKLAKIKEEEAFLNPRVVIYHEVLSDREIQALKTTALPYFQRSRVNNRETKTAEVAHYRISQSSWLQSGDHPYVNIIYRRIEDITGLDMNSAEAFQIGNYGMGGHYAPHFDFFQNENRSDDRIATFLFYMSDVEIGGATAFPVFKLSVWPTKGSAVFWYNLEKNGKQNFLTLHGACPVLLGSKWVCNVWIHSKGQEFRHPCGLSEDI